MRANADKTIEFSLAAIAPTPILVAGVNSVSERQKQHTKQVGKEKAVRVSVWKRLLLIAGGCVLLACVGFAGVHYFSISRQAKPYASAATRENFKQPTTLAELVSLKLEQLGAVDIGVMNMLCAEGLPGAEGMRADAYRTTLDQWAEHVKSETARNFHHFREDPAHFYNSEAFYKMLMMAVVVYEDFGIRYNPKWMAPPSETRADDHFFADSRDIFIHGMVGPQHMGTCSSMPVFYIALGRRLGYPLKLVATKQHLFMRWDTPAERFDMDATGKGLDRYDDDYYKKWPFPITEQEIQEEGYLKSLSPSEELSVFFAIRAACLKENGFYADAGVAFQAAYFYAPNWKGNQVMLAYAQRKQRSIGMPGPPQAVVFQQQGVNPSIPADPSPFQQMPSSRKSP
ncbi:MAG TPA: hypothetical protein VGW37_18515 [Terriglobia bacterium]|nr:hypothetical protein [Terriglobia bacterium]